MIDTIEQKLVPVPIDIEFDYDGPVSLDFFHDAMATLFAAAEHAALETLPYEELDSLGITGDTLESLKTDLAKLSRDMIWIDFAECGSLNFKGKLLAGILSGLVLMFVGDVAKESREYNNLTKATAARVDSYVASFRSYLESHAGDPADPETIFIEARIVGDRLRVHIVPNKRRNDITLLL